MCSCRHYCSSDSANENNHFGNLDTRIATAQNKHLSTIARFRLFVCVAHIWSQYNPFDTHLCWLRSQRIFPTAQRRHSCVLCVLPKQRSHFNRTLHVPAACWFAQGGALPAIFFTHICPMERNSSDYWLHSQMPFLWSLCTSLCTAALWVIFQVLAIIQMPHFTFVSHIITHCMHSLFWWLQLSWGTTEFQFFNSSAYIGIVQCQ